MINAFDRLQMARRSDFLIASTLVEEIQSRSRKARRFVFDTDASRRVGEIVRDMPELLVREQAFARAPFDQCWIELDHPTYWETLTGLDPDATADVRVAFFIDHDTVYSVAAGQRNNPDVAAGISMIGYRLHTPWEIADQLAFIAKTGNVTSRIGLDHYLWGATYRQIDTEAQRSLRARHTAFIMPFTERRRTPSPAMWEIVLRESAGELKLIVALLLMLNRPGVTRYTDVPASRGVYKGKQRRYLEHTVVSIDIDPAPLLRKVGTPADNSTPKRRHEVRGHWCHDQTYRTGQARGCLHTWEVEPDNENQFTCRNCGGLRWWRIAHMRGSALEGFVAHDGFDVTA